MPVNKINHIKTISAFHRAHGLPQPDHPLISVIDYDAIQYPNDMNDIRWMLDFYTVSLKKVPYSKVKYGQQEYDFDAGVMFFTAPKQIFQIELDITKTTELSGWILLIHPDFFWNTPLTTSINKYQYFNYAVNEALFISEKEENILKQIILQIRQECSANLDKFSRNIIVSQVETLLNYADRFYQRQFITREKSSHQILDQLEILLKKYFQNEDIATLGLPTVRYISEGMNISTSYLGSLLKSLTGLSPQQYIHEEIIKLAKEKLSTTQLTVSQIAYELGFEQPQSFSRLFKAKTKQSPLEFRRSFECH